MHGCAIKQYIQGNSYALESEYILFKHSFCLAQTALFLQPKNKYHFVSSPFFFFPLPLQWNYLLRINPSFHSYHSSAYSLNILHNDDYWCLLCFILSCRTLDNQPCRNQPEIWFLCINEILKIRGRLEIIIEKKILHVCRSHMNRALN